MARGRNIKPGFFINHNLAKLNPLTRILFEGLWCIADREGRLHDIPEKIKVLILPYDDCNVDEMLNDLAGGPEIFIYRYEVDGEKYIQITNFKKHQNPHRNEAPSTIPAIAPEKHSTSTVQVPERHSTNPADSLNLIPDSLNLIPCCDNNAREEQPQPLNLFTVFEQEFGRTLSPIEIEQIQKWEDEHSPEVIREALKIAVLLGKYSFRYIDTILLEWHKNNIRTVQQVIEFHDKHKKTKAGPKNRGPDQAKKDKFKLLYMG